MRSSVSVSNTHLGPLLTASCGNRLFTDVYLLYIDEEEVVGLCGLHKEYAAFGDNKKRKMYPWMVSIEIQVNVSAALLELQRLHNDMDPSGWNNRSSISSLYNSVCDLDHR